MKQYNILMDENKIVNSNSDNEKQLDETKTFKKVMQYLIDLCFLILVNYIILFLIYPGVCLKGQLFSLSPSLNVNTIFLIFNVFDTIGRYGPNYIEPSKPTTKIMVFFRFLFLFTFSATAISYKTDFLGFFANSYFIIINMALLGLTNGFITSSIFTLGAQNVPDESLKGKAGGTLSFFLIVGIFSGSLLALFVMKNVI